MKRLTAIALLMLALPFICSAGEDDFCTWTTFRVNRVINDKWSFGALTEGRSRNSATDQFYVRPFVAYKVAGGFGVKMQTDLAFLTSGFSLRLIPEASYTFGLGDFSFMLRQRLMSTWKESSDSWSHLLRTKGMITYQIPGTGICPTAAVEPFYWDGLSRCRYYGGVKLLLSKASSLTVQYVRQDFSGGRTNENLLWIMYSVNLF